VPARRSSLDPYRARRNFARTQEPSPKLASQEGRRFVVQHHWATRDHHDFRIELDGVLKSWAVTKPPSLDPKVRRLAVRTEDHPVDYATFEGTIPKGEYGGGTAMVWDELPSTLGYLSPVEFEERAMLA
jgi:bifunctional non-homologous end joining protein LigD